MDQYTNSSKERSYTQHMDKHLKAPTITIFMAVYNGQRYLAEAIKSVLDQTYKDFELLIVNDGSTDNSAEIVNSFTDQRIRLITNIENKGLVYTRNLGIQLAKGDYIAILDCDDLALPYRLQLQLDFMKQHPAVALCGGHAAMIDSQGEDLQTPIRVIVGHQDMSLNLLFGNMFVNSSLMLKKEVLEELGGYHPYQLAEDFELSVRIADKYEIANIDYELVKYRLHESNVSKREKEMEHYVKKIIANMHSGLGIAFDESLINIHYSFLTGNLDKESSSDFLDLFCTLKKANTIKNKYPFNKFNAHLIQQWYDLLFDKKERKIAYYFFSTKVFELQSATAQQIRRVLKQSFKNIFKAGIKVKSGGPFQ